MGRGAARWLVLTGLCFGGTSAAVWAQGACCTADSCIDVETQGQCNGLGGVLLEGEDCANDPCAEGACCDGVNCGLLPAFPCITSGRTFAGAGTTCLDDPCGADVGACCQEGACTDDSPEDCAADGGVWLGAGTDCTQDLCDLGACCEPGVCEVLARYECTAAEGSFDPAGDCVTAPCEVPGDCATNSLYAQSPSTPLSFTGYKSESAAGLKRSENFSGVVGAIETVKWWGFDLLANFGECDEPDPTFEIEFRTNAAGLPGDTVCSHTLPASRTPTGEMYGTAELIEYEITLPTSCVLSEGWISLVGLGNPTCQFFWLSSPDGDLLSVCEGCQELIEPDDLSMCLGGSVGGVFGSCCDQSTGGCSDDVEIPDCIGPGLRFTADTTCAELDPPCAQVTGGCCFADGNCFQDLAGDCVAAGGNWLGAGASCDLCPDVGACCVDESFCSLLTQAECAPFGALWLGQDSTCVQCPEPVGCSPGLFTQSPDPPSDFIAGSSESSADLRRWENYVGVAGAIEGLTWFGLDLEHLGGNNFVECVETVNQFQISFHEDAGGVPGEAVCSYLVPATYTPTGGLKYLGTELNEYNVALPTPCVLINGWVSIVGLGDPDCWFLWMSSSAGDGESYCDNCQPSPQEFDLNACFEGSVGGLFGSCCDDLTGQCGDGVEIPACLGESRRFSTEDSCSELDPPCGVILGACCTDQGSCTRRQQGPCTFSGGNWLGANTLCDQCPCVTPCPAGGLPEGEQVCGDQYVDGFNGGCFAADPQFSPIAMNDEVCGESGVFQLGAEVTGDYDWYEIDVPVATRLTWSVEAEFRPRVWIYGGDSGCEGAPLLGTAAAFECDVVEVSSFVLPGTYWLAVGPSGFLDSAECPSRYTARATERPVGFRLDVDRVMLSWTPQNGALRYDVVRGDLETLRSSGGDFVAATEQCVADNLTLTSLPYSDEPSVPGEGFWFLVRAVGLTGNGTYDTGEPGQIESRDAELEIAPLSCP